MDKNEENHLKKNGVDIVDSAKKHGTLRTEIPTIIGYLMLSASWKWVKVDHKKWLVI